MKINESRRDKVLEEQHMSTFSILKVVRVRKLVPLRRQSETYNLMYAIQFKYKKKGTPYQS